MSIFSNNEAQGDYCTPTYEGKQVSNVISEVYGVEIRSAVYGIPISEE